MSEESAAHDPITWEDTDPDEGAAGAFEILYDRYFPYGNPLVQEATGRAIDDDVVWRPAHLFSCDLGGERCILRVSAGYHLSYWLPSYHAGLDSKDPGVREECEPRCCYWPGGGGGGPTGAMQ
jgi:hypothetical protein